VNDRLPYADVSIATVLVVVGIALAAYPWLGTATFPVAALACSAVLGTLAAAARRSPASTTRPIASGEIPWT
jgi:hypothetical protein